MAKIIWTSEKPVKPGWYWWRRTAESKPTLIEYEAITTNFAFELSTNNLWAQHGYGQWAGPLDPPEEAP